LRYLPQPSLPDGYGLRNADAEQRNAAALKYLGSMLNQNLSALLLGVFNILIHRLSAEDDIAVNMPWPAGRCSMKYDRLLHQPDDRQN
jgi:hypothetical protein